MSFLKRLFRSSRTQEPTSTPDLYWGYPEEDSMENLGQSTKHVLRDVVLGIILLVVVLLVAGGVFLFTFGLGAAYR